MINFRYHIVSLMAVFLALSVGIVLGVTLRGPVDEGIAAQAVQDRRQVTDLRAELDRRNALDDYRDAYALRVGKELDQGWLSGDRVLLVVMPGAPGAVVSALGTAVTDAGGVLTHTVKVNEAVFDPARAADVKEAVSPFTSQLALTDSMSSGTEVGLTLGQALLTKGTAQRDAAGSTMVQALTRAGLVSVSGRSTEQARLAVVVTAEATDPPVARDVLTSHVDLDVAFNQHARGVVLAGPNSETVDGTEVLQARSGTASDQLSTVDVADLASGVTTTILAGREQLLDRQGHYGALTKADAPLPALPVR